MTRTCVVCNTQSNKMHRFPRTAKRCRQWATILGFDNWEELADTKQSRSIRICSGHFSPDQFNESGHLKHLAIPTPYEDFWVHREVERPAAQLGQAAERRNARIMGAFATEMDLAPSVKEEGEEEEKGLINQPGPFVNPPSPNLDEELEEEEPMLFEGPSRVKEESLEAPEPSSDPLFERDECNDGYFLTSTRQINKLFSLINHCPECDSNILTKTPKNSGASLTCQIVCIMCSWKFDWSSIDKKKGNNQ